MFCEMKIVQLQKSTVTEISLCRRRDESVSVVPVKMTVKMNGWRECRLFYLLFCTVYCSGNRLKIHITHNIKKVLLFNLPSSPIFTHCSVHGVQHMFLGNFSPGNCCCKSNCTTIYQKIFFLTENIPHEKQKDKKSGITYLYLFTDIKYRGGNFTTLNFWRQVACVLALLNVIDVMTGTRHQHGAIKCM